MTQPGPGSRARLWRIGVGIETAGALLLAALLVHVLPFRVTARLFGAVRPADAPPEVPAPHPAAGRARTVGLRVERVARRLPWPSSCLVQAVALALLLARRGIAGWSIRFGVSKAGGSQTGASTAGGPLTAHAWMMLGPDIVIGASEAATHTPLADLGRAGAPRRG